MYTNSTPTGKKLMSDDCNRMKNVNDAVLEGNLRIVDAFSLPNFNTDNKTADPQDHPQNSITKDPPALPTTYTLKKKKLEHFIDNLFKVASEKVTQPDDIVKTEIVVNDETVLTEDEGVESCLVTSEELLKVETFLLENQEEVKEESTECVKIESNNEEFEEVIGDTNLFSFAQSLVEVKYSKTSCGSVNLKVKSEHEKCIKEEKDTKPAERMFGWCSIEDLKNPSVQSMTVSSSKVNINGDLDIKEEDFQSKPVG